LVIFRYISTKVGDKVYQLLCKISFKNLHELLKSEQKLKGLFFFSHSHAHLSSLEIKNG